ncbi:MAG: hypothetical protein ABSG07_22780, partial [Terriglobales bacterium]
MGAADSGANLGANSGANSGADGARETARLSSSGATQGARVASAVPDDRITDLDRKVFAGKRVYGRTLNMPNLNSSTGSVGSGRLIALGIHPVTPTGPVPVPAGNRRGTFAATPQG